MSAGAIDAGRASITLALDAKGLQTGLNAAAQAVAQSTSAMASNGGKAGAGLTNAFSAAQAAAQAFSRAAPAAIDALANAFGGADGAAKAFGDTSNAALDKLAKKLSEGAALASNLFSALGRGASFGGGGMVGGIRATTDALHDEADAMREVGDAAAGAAGNVTAYIQAGGGLGTITRANALQAGALAVPVFGGGFSLGRWARGALSENKIVQDLYIGAAGPYKAPQIQDSAAQGVENEKKYAEWLKVNIERLDILAKKTRLTADETKRAGELIAQLTAVGVKGYSLSGDRVDIGAGAKNAAQKVINARLAQSQQAVIGEQQANLTALYAAQKRLTNGGWTGMSAAEQEAEQIRVAGLIDAANTKRNAARMEIARLEGKGAAAARDALEKEKKALEKEEQAEQTRVEVAKMRAALAQVEIDSAAAVKKRDEDLAIKEGKASAATLAGDYAAQAADAQYRAAEIATAMMGLNKTSAQYKALAQEYANAYGEYKQAAARADDLRQQSEESARAAGKWYRAGGVDAIDLERETAAAGRKVSGIISAATSAGDVALLESMKKAADEFAAEAQMAAQSARDLAIADGVVTDAEGKRVAGLEAVYSAAAGQVEALADALETTTARAQKMGITGGGGTDAQAVFARAMADAMKNSKSEEYQKKTADATGKMADYLSKLKGKALTFE